MRLLLSLAALMRPHQWLKNTSPEAVAARLPHCRLKPHCHCSPAVRADVPRSATAPSTNQASGAALEIAGKPAATAAAARMKR